MLCRPHLRDFQKQPCRKVDIILILQNNNWHPQSTHIKWTYVWRCMTTMEAVGPYAGNCQLLDGLEINIGD